MPTSRRRTNAKVVVEPIIYHDHAAVVSETAAAGYSSRFASGTLSRMGGFGGNGGIGRVAQLLALGAGCLTLANCSSGLSSRVDPKYGTSASARVGEPVPKGGGVYRVGKPYTIAGRVYVP